MQANYGCGMWDLGNLGLALQRQDDAEAARRHWRQALAIFEEIRSPLAETVRGWLEEEG